MSKKAIKAQPPFEPVDCLSSIFTARRDLQEPIRKYVIRDSGVTVDDADTLVYLYGNKELNWQSFPMDDHGFVPVGELRKALVHDRGLFSRRIQKLISDGLIEGRHSARERGGKRQYIMAARITPAGIKVTKPIWERYCQLAETLLAEVSESEMKTHYLVNQKISEGIARLQKTSSDQD